MTHYNSFLTVYGHYYTSFILIVLRTRAALMSHLAVVVAQVVFIIIIIVLLYLITFICLPLQTVIAVLGSHFHICQACQTACVWSELVVDLLLL